MTATQLTYIRTGATVVITVLTGLMSVYPHSMWVPLMAAAIASGSAVGIHAIPSIAQTVTTGGITMTTPLTGAELMGISRPTVTPEPPPVEPTSVEPTPVKPTPVEPTPVEPTPVTSVPATTVDPTVADLLDNVISGLQKIATMVRTETL